MNKLELNRERRRAAGAGTPGTNNPRCSFCGYRRSLALELHHVAGQAFGDDMVPVCRNCHRVSAIGRRIIRQRSGEPAKRIGAHQRASCSGFADMFELLVKRLREFAAKLAALEAHANPQNGETRP